MQKAYALRIRSRLSKILKLTSLSGTRKTSRRTNDPTGRVSAVLSEATSSVADSVYYSYDVETIGGKRLVRVTSTDEAGVVTRSYTDALGRQVRTVADVGGIEATTVIEYDVLDRLIDVTDPEGQTTTYVYNEVGHLVQKSTPDAGTVKSIYDDMGNLRFSQDAKQAAGWTKYALFYTYDIDNRPLIYGQIAVSDFDDLDPYEFSLPAQSTWISRNAYDAKPNTGEFPWSLFASEINNTFLGNLGGRLAANAYKSGGLWQLTLYAYDNDGQLLNKYIFSTNWSGVNSTLNTRLHYQRNRQSQVTRLWTRVGSQNWYQWHDYDGAGRLAEVRSGTSSLKSSSVLDAVYTYRPSGAIASRQFQGGPVTPYGYTIREWLSSIGNTASTTYRFSARYTYFPNGNVNEAEFYNQAVPAYYKRYRFDHTYDNLNRLLVADYLHADPTTGVFTNPTHYYVNNITYDKNGNIKKLQRRRENGSLVDNLTYNYHSTIKNRLVSVSDASGAPTNWDTGTLSFSYDANGNVRFFDDLSRSIYRDVIYDHRNLPLYIETLDYMDGASYRYTADGHRYYRGRYFQTAEHYVLDDATTVGVFTETGTRRHWNIVANGQVIGRFEGTTRKYYHTDMLGSTRAVTNTSNTVLEANDYYPFGHIMPGRSYLSGTATREGFTGKERGGEGGWDYFGARYYVPAIGRWLVTDPLADEYPGLSPYNYVLNNPLANVDPDGRLVVGLTVNAFAHFLFWGRRLTAGIAMDHRLRVAAFEGDRSMRGPGMGVGATFGFMLSAAPTIYDIHGYSRSYAYYAIYKAGAYGEFGGFDGQPRSFGGNVFGFGKGYGLGIRVRVEGEYTLTSKVLDLPEILRRLNEGKQLPRGIMKAIDAIRSESGFDGPTRDIFLWLYQQMIRASNQDQDNNNDRCSRLICDDRDYHEGWGADQGELY